MRQEALVNPELLVWARESINMDLDEAALRVGVGPARMDEWETGRRRPTINQARKMSQVYRRPLAAFYLPTRPASLGFAVPHDFRRLPQDQPSTPSPELVTELRRIEYLREVAIELVDPPPQQPREFIGTVRLGDPPDTVAHRVVRLLALPMSARERWKTDYEALNSWKDAIEQRGVLVMHLNGVEVAEVRGIAVAEPVFPLIAVNGKDSPTGRAFTLVHEFVHLLLGATGMSDLRVGESARTDDQRLERFCNLIAGEVLVPRQALMERRPPGSPHGLREWTDEAVADLARHFKVSREVIVRRLAILGLATEEFYRRKRSQYAKEREAAGKPTGGPLPMSRRILRAIGQPFARIALDAYNREVISSSELAELLGARLKHLPAVEELLEGRNTLTGGDE